MKNFDTCDDIDVDAKGRLRQFLWIWRRNSQEWGLISWSIFLVVKIRGGVRFVG